MTDLLTIKEAARRLDKSGRVSPQWVRKRLRELDLPVVVLSNKHFVEPSVMDELLERCRVKPSDPASTSAAARAGHPSGSFVMAIRKSSPAAVKVINAKLRSDLTSTAWPDGKPPAKETG